MRLAEPNDTCLSRIEIERLVSGESSDLPQQAHLLTCTACRAKAEAIRRSNQLIAELRRSQTASCAPPANSNMVRGYEIVREIHRGAQGIVYEALQLATKRRVAIKTIGRGRFATSRQRARFEREIEIVAALRHPNIAMLYESGATSDGSAYFAMEYVAGVPLHEARPWKTINPRATAEMFKKICLAVSHAHQHGVIHHDLKPANILVDQDGEPRVLDFGLAWAPRLEAGENSGARTGFAGTFAYASPEQLQSETEHIDLRSDVYSLGVILFELLTGTLPHSDCDTIDDLIAAKCGHEVISPRKLRSEIDRDLETIVIKAMAAQAAHRYRSASELFEDLERYLDGRPIISRQDSLGYVLMKLVQRRRKLAISSAVAALIILSLLIFSVILFARHEREQDKSTDTLAAFQQVLESADPLSGLSSDTRLDAFLDHVGRNVQNYLVDQPETAASVHTTLGQVALNMADYADAHAHFSKALAMRREALEEGDPAIAESLHNLGRATFYMGRYEEAAALYRDALEQRKAILGDSHSDVANTMSHLASCLRRLGEMRTAEDLLRKALAIRESGAKTPGAEIAASLNNLGSLLMETGRHEQALALFERALLMVESELGPNDWRVAHALHNRASCLNKMERFGEAVMDLLRAQAIWERLVSPDHPSLARVQIELARSSIHLGRTEQAQAMLTAAIQTKRARLGSRHPNLAEHLELLGQVLTQRGEYEQAIAALEEALEIRLETSSTGDAMLIDTLLALGHAFTRMGHFDDAEPVLLEAWQLAESGVALRPQQPAACLNGLIAMYETWGRQAKAEQYRQLLASQQAGVAASGAEGENDN